MGFFTKDDDDKDINLGKVSEEQRKRMEWVIEQGSKDARK